MKNKVTEEDLKGAISDFPIEVVKLMMKRQYEQYKETNIKAFQNPKSIENESTLNWDNTKEGYIFWDKVIHNKDFDIFFEKYPKENKYIPNHKGLRIYFRGDPERYIDIINEFCKLCSHVNGLRCDNKKYLYYLVQSKNKLMLSQVIEDSIEGELIKQVYKEGKLSYKPKIGEICIGKDEDMDVLAIGKYTKYFDKYGLQISPNVIKSFSNYYKLSMNNINI